MDHSNDLDGMITTLEGITRGLKGGTIKKCYVVWHNDEGVMYAEGHGLDQQEVIATLETAKHLELAAYVQVLRDMF